MTRQRISASFATFILCVLATTAGSVSGQTGRPPVFERISVDQGLSQSYVTALVQDRQGFLWVGTQDGLNRYDGYGFTTYRFTERDSRSISDNQISALAADANGRVWVGTAAGGLNAYDPRTNSFTRFRHDERDPGSLQAGLVSSVFADRLGRIWVATSSGLSRLDPGASTFKQFPQFDRPPSIGLGAVRAIEEDSAGHLLLGTAHGLLLFEREAFLPVAVRAPGEDRAGRPIRWMARGSDGLLSLVDDVGPLRIVSTASLARSSDGGSLEVEAAPFATRLLDGTVSAIAVAADSALWIGNYDGLRIVATTQPAPGHATLGQGGGSRVSGGVTCLLRDRAGLMWVGTNGSGLYKLNRSRMRFSHLVPAAGNPSTRAIEEDADGNIWIGGYAGLLRYDRATGSVNALPASRGNEVPVKAYVHTVYQDPVNRKRLWIGTEGSGLFAYDREQDRFTPYPRAESSDRRRTGARVVLCVYRAGDGTLWVGAAEGLFRVDERARTIRPGPSVARSGGGREPTVYFVTELRGHPGWLWVGTNDGLVLLPAGQAAIAGAPDVRQVRYVNDPRNSASISHDHLYSLLEDHAGGVWIGTAQGLNRVGFGADPMLPARFERVTTADGLPNDCVYSVLEDEAHRKWVSTNRGVSRFAVEEHDFRNFDQADGLQSNEFNSGARLRARDGRIFFGGVNGVSAFYPADLAKSTYEPPVVLTGFQAFNVPITGDARARFLTEEITVASEVHLSYEDRVVSFEFASLDFTSPQKNRYECMMQGWGTDSWLSLGTGRRATYTNLPPGTFTFLVRGSNADGNFGRTPASIRVIVAPPYWQTWWFRAVALIFFASVVYGAHALRTRSIRRTNLVLQAEIDQRRRTEDALREAEAKYRTIFEGALAGIFQTTLEGRVLSANPAMAKILGYDSPDELVSSLSDIAQQAYVDPRDRDVLLSRVRTEDEVRGFASQLKRKDGSPVWVDLTSRLVKGPDGTPLFLEGTVEDVTERRKLEEQLTQAQKMESVGRLAGGVAHDFNNMLTVISGYADLAMDDARGTPAAESLAQIKKAAETATRLTAQLLAFARRQVIQPVVVSPNQLIRRIEPLIRQLVGEDVLVRLDLDDAAATVKIDPNQFEQILVNLAANSRDAMPGGGTLQIDTRGVVLDEAYAAGHEGVRPGPYALVSVSDTGTGIDKAVLPQVFEPFFTTKVAGRGTGLGLSTVYGIVKQHQGHIWVYSEIGLGTTFKIYFPKAPDEGGPPPAPVRQTDVRGTGLILVVEDEDLVRTMAVTSLRGAGYTVLVAADGPSALELIKDNRPDLVVTDVVMPKMSGRELAAEVARLHPGVPVLYTSGYTENMIAHHGVLDEGVEFLQKPYSPRDLAARVRAILDR
jgi:PAS domain S-box-containing protein